MELISWSQALSVNIEQIDNQHKKLIGLLNDLHDAMAVGKGSAAIGTVLASLIDYTKVHFATEEELMEKYLYPGYIRHKKEHENLVSQVEELNGKFKSGKPVLSLEVMQFLKNWLSGHILGVDKMYTTYLNNKGVK